MHAEECAKYRPIFPVQFLSNLVSALFKCTTIPHCPVQSYIFHILSRFHLELFCLGSTRNRRTICPIPLNATGLPSSHSSPGGGNGGSTAGGGGGGGEEGGGRREEGGGGGAVGFIQGVAIYVGRKWFQSSLTTNFTYMYICQPGLLCTKKNSIHA